MHRGNDATVIEAQTISGVDAFRLRRNTGVMQGTVQPIAGLVSGEHATSSVGSIRSGCAKPMTAIRAIGSPNEGTGRPQ